MCNHASLSTTQHCVSPKMGCLEYITKNCIDVQCCYRDGFLSSVARSLQKKVGSVVPPISSTASGTTEAENLEDSMRKVDNFAFETLWQLIH